MRMIGLQDLTASYVRTLREWRANFEAHEQRLEELGYDQRFQRLWRLYLAYCEAGFAERRITDVQVLLAQPQSRRRVSSSDSRAMSATVS
jgi:cyclopropane-fatty-acyl-phospholipid synthase